MRGVGENIVLLILQDMSCVLGIGEALVVHTAQWSVHEKVAMAEEMISGIMLVERKMWSMREKDLCG